MPTAKIYYMIFFAIMLPSLAVIAETEVGGLIGTNTVWSAAESPYVVKNDVVVRDGVKLTIESGIEIRFNSGRSLIIKGSLAANGTSASPVIFTSNESIKNKPFWGNIEFEETDLNSSMTHCIIECSGANGRSAIKHCRR
jgi:hypothetical protein